MKRNELVSLVAGIGSIAVCSSVLFSKMFIPIKINGESMEPTFHHLDVALINGLKVNKRNINRFDVVVLKCKSLNKNIIKRVIGLPGEKIEYYDDKLYVNGIYVKEPFLRNIVKDRSLLFTNNFIVDLKHDEFFVLGDNRLKSVDSRVLGTFRYDDIIGKQGVVVYPFKNIDIIE